MPIRQRTGLVVVGIAAILLLAFIFVVPALINVDRYRPHVISYLQEKTGKQVEIGRLALTFFPLTIHIDRIGVKNPPIFPSGYVIQVARIDAELSVGALLHRQVVIKSLVLEDPVLNLTSDPDGPWNFENPQSKISADALPLRPISSVKVKRGLVIASNLLPSDKAGPIFFEAHEIFCELQQVNLAGIINPSSSSMDGQGSLKAGLLRFGAVEARNLNSKLRLESRHVFFTDIKAEVYGGSAVGGLSFDLSEKNANFKTNARLSRINLAQLLAAFPKGGGKMTGKMEGEVRLAGEIAHSLRPLAGIHGAGHLTVRALNVAGCRRLSSSAARIWRLHEFSPCSKSTKNSLPRLVPSMGGS